LFSNFIGITQIKQEVFRASVEKDKVGSKSSAPEWEGHRNSNFDYYMNLIKANTIGIAALKEEMKLLESQFKPMYRKAKDANYLSPELYFEGKSVIELEKEYSDLLVDGKLPKGEFLPSHLDRYFLAGPASWKAQADPLYA